MLFTCNHHQADTRIVLHASRSIKRAVILATDTDVLVLLTHAYPQCNNAKQQLMKTKPGMFIDIKTIYNFFGNGICQILPGLIVLLVVILSPTHLALENLALVLQDVGKTFDSFKRLDIQKLIF